MNCPYCDASLADLILRDEDVEISGESLLNGGCFNIEIDEACPKCRQYLRIDIVVGPIDVLAYKQEA
jgi:hypothetical protein